MDSLEIPFKEPLEVYSFIKGFWSRWETRDSKRPCTEISGEAAASGSKASIQVAFMSLWLTYIYYIHSQIIYLHIYIHTHIYIGKYVHYIIGELVNHGTGLSFVLQVP